MNNKKLMELLEEHFISNKKNEFVDFIKNTELTINDYKKLALVLIQAKLFDYIPIYNYAKVIENIDNEEFMNNEENYF